MINHLLKVKFDRCALIYILFSCAFKIKIFIFCSVFQIIFEKSPILKIYNLNRDYALLEADW